MNKKNITPPQDIFDEKEKYYPDVAKFLTILRNEILKISIEELIITLDWNNEKYYQMIVNGYKDQHGNKKYKQPTVNYLFTGLNNAMNNNKKFKENKDKIINLINKYIMKF